MAVIRNSLTIDGVAVAELVAFADARGEFRETFRAEWFPQAGWGQVQSNRSDSQAHVMRGLHFHRNQTDYWLVTAGSIKVGLCDLRRNSRTFRAVEVMVLSAADERGLFIPVGMAHGFYTLTDATVTYLVNNYYDASDEYGVAWDDPELGVPWGVKNPIVSERDVHNPLFRNLPATICP